MALYSSLITPVEFSFFSGLGAPWTLITTDLIVNAFFMMDIVLTFRVVFKDSKTMTLVSDRKQIAVRWDSQQSEFMITPYERF